MTISKYKRTLNSDKAIQRYIPDVLVPLNHYNAHYVRFVSYAALFQVPVKMKDTTGNWDKRSSFYVSSPFKSVCWKKKAGSLHVLNGDLGKG